VVGFTYTLETSSNLLNWTPIWTNLSPFCVLDDTGLAGRFYRAVLVQ